MAGAEGWNRLGITESLQELTCLPLRSAEVKVAPGTFVDSPKAVISWFPDGQVES